MQALSSWNWYVYGGDRKHGQKIQQHTKQNKNTRQVNWILAVFNSATKDTNKGLERENGEFLIL